MRFLDLAVAGVEDGWVVARLQTLEAGVKVFVWTGECHARVGTHVVVNWEDPGQVLHPSFDLIVGKQPPFRLRVTPKKGRNEFTVRLLRGVGEDEVHVQREAEVSVVNIEFLFSRIFETMEILLVKLSVE